MPVIDRATLHTLLRKPKGPVGLESVCVADVSYDPESNDMTIEFVERGTYVYHNVPLGVYTDLSLAESQGRYFNLYVRDQYDYEKVA